MSNLFPHITEHRVYPSTFLAAVEWRVHFHLKDFEDAYPLFSDFVKSTFGLDLLKPNFKAMSIHPIRFKRGEEARVKLTPHFAEFYFEGDGYESYADSVRDLLKSFMELIEKVGGEVKHISCNKKNFIGVQRNTPGDEPELLSLIFDSNLLDSEVAVLKMGNLAEVNVESINFIELDDNSGFPVKALFGAVTLELPDDVEPNSDKTVDDSEDQEYEYGVIMESQCDKFFSHEEKSDMSAPDKINSELYDFFHWAYNNNVLESLDEIPVAEA